jgi:drug/metabolite transporter (DMT)-like permease
MTALAAVASASLAQVLVCGMTFPAFFWLQQQGAPVLLSQIGYVTAAIGLIGATRFLGERYSLTTWLGARITAPWTYIEP